MKGFSRLKDAMEEQPAHGAPAKQDAIPHDIAVAQGFRQVVYCISVKRRRHSGVVGMATEPPEGQN
jgi:hypothetical protein